MPTQSGAMRGSRAFFPAPRRALLFARRRFYSGLDDNRIQRLRRSGMTFNKPRGRDTLSLAFESRIRLLPLLQVRDLYGPVDGSLLAAPKGDDAPSAVHPRDPTGSAGNPLELKKYHQGDSRFQKVVEEKRKQEQQARTKDEWNILVVDPIPMEARNWPVCYPSMHPLFYADWDAFQDGNRRTRVLNRQPVAVGKRQDSLPDLAHSVRGDNEFGALTDADTEMIDMSFFRNDNKRQLQQNGDTTRFPGSFRCSHHFPDAGGHGTRVEQESRRVVTQQFYLAACVDPFIDVERFRREEAQVEMISAYRNILYEATEATSQQAHPGTHLQGPPVDVVRVPALCCYTCGSRFLHEIGKLNQQALIKGFHRLSNEAKEMLIMNKAFTFEIYVPPPLLPHFEAAFLEDAWPTPESTLNPGRTALYPSLAPPRSLLDYDGWVGKRPELVEAVETDGKSLMRGQKYNLDGTPITEQEVFAQVRVFGARADESKMLEGERMTAFKDLGVEVERRYAPLHAGLEGEEPQHQQRVPASQRSHGADTK